MSAGQKAALDHIAQGQRLSRELGDADAEVKHFLFARSAEEISKILDEYERQFGPAARKYAEKTIPAWRTGRTLMSGVVAERLFRLLPRFMTLEKKLELCARLWHHTSPSSSKVFQVAPDVAPDELKLMLQEHLQRVVIPHQWPSQLEERFDWLASHDVQVKQHLMNSLQSEESLLLADAIAKNVTPLINDLHSTTLQSNLRATHSFAVRKHRVSIVFQSPPPLQNKAGCLATILYVVGPMAASIALMREFVR